MGVDLKRGVLRISIGIRGKIDVNRRCYFEIFVGRFSAVMDVKSEEASS